MPIHPPTPHQPAYQPPTFQYSHLCFDSLLYSSTKLFCIVARYCRRAKEQTPRPLTAGSNMARLVSLLTVSSQNSFGTWMPPKPTMMHKQHSSQSLLREYCCKSVYTSVCPSVYPSLCLSVVNPSVYPPLSLCLPICLSPPPLSLPPPSPPSPLPLPPSLPLFIHLCVCLPICLSLSLSVHPSVYPSLCLSVHLFIPLSVCPSICLSLSLSVHLSPSVCLPLPPLHLSLFEHYKDTRNMIKV